MWCGCRQGAGADARPAATAANAACQQPDQNSPDAGGPGGDNGVIALPKKKEEAPEPPPPPKPEVKNPPGMGNFSLRVDVPVVTVDTAVILQKTHAFVPGPEGVQLPDS